MKYVAFALLFCAIIGVEVSARVRPSARCDSRYFQHYVVKGCQPVFEAGNSECPVRFSCPATPPPADKTGCKVEGRIIPIGEDVPTGNPCQICSCRPGWDGEPPRIVCAGVECPSAFGPRVEEDCYEIYEKDSCCSTGKVCGSAADSIPFTCSHEGETYRSGQRIHSVRDPCLVCTCHEGWTGKPDSDPGCRRLSCLLEKDLGQMAEGCLPIYHEATCCPIEYDCGQNVRNTTTPMATEADIASGNSCAFHGSHYRLGQLLDIGHPTHCVTCECVTPPEFTCVHQSCTWPEDPACVPHHVEGQCCPEFECGSG